MAWILATLKKILTISNERRACELETLIKQIKYGVSAQILFISEILDLDREFSRRLYNNGIKTEAQLLSIDYSQLSSLLPGKIAAKAYKTIQSIKTKTTKTTMPPPVIQNTLIEFTGNFKGALREIKISGKLIYLQPQLYAYFQKLWWAYNSEDKWIAKENLGPGNNQAKYISKIRSVLKDNNADVKIVSDGRGAYSLILPERVHCPVVAGKI
jgi:hypothetical protein